MKKNRWGLWFSAALIAFTVYIALDTFVLSASYNSNAVEMNTSMFAEDFAVQRIDSADSSDSGASGEASEESSSFRWSSGEFSRPGSSGDDSDSSDSSDSDSESSRPSSSWSRPDSSGWSDSFSWSGSSGWSGSSSRPSRPGSSDGSSRRDYMKSADSAEGVDAAAEYSGDTSYSDENIQITLTEYNQNDTRIYVAEVTVSSAQYVKAAFANDTYGKNITESTSAMAVAHNAILAVNGDYYGAQERGYVIRNGIVYRNTADDTDVLCLYADGTMGIVSDRTCSAEELVESGVWQAFSFGPALVENGQISVDRNDEVGMGLASNPRTAVGMIDANHFLFVVSDGRTAESEGLSLYELAQFMQSLGVTTAYNLDGGGSSTMYFNGQVVNNPTSGGRIKERGVSDIVYIG